MKKHIDQLINLLNSYNLVKAVSGTSKGLTIDRITTDSRNVCSGTMYICKGNTFKIEYLNEAINKGAIAYVSEEIYNNDIPCISVFDVRKALSIISRWYYDCAGDDMNLIGITGTKGKTSTAYILKSIFDTEKEKNTALFSTEGVDTCKQFYVTHLTTPESIDVQRYYKEAKENGCNNVVMEVSSQAMKYDRLYSQRFNIGIFLNIDRDHIGANEHANMEEYLNCKIDFLKNCDTVIICEKTNKLNEIIACIPDKDVIIISRGTNDLNTGHKKAIVSDVNMNTNGTSFTLSYNDNILHINTNLIGDFNIDNVSVAAIAALNMNISPIIIEKALKNIYVPGRMMLYNHNGIDIIVDYAHNKISVQNLYETVRNQFNPKRIISVFGCAGERSAFRRKDLGILADKYSDLIYLTADDPGFEDVELINNEIKEYIERPCIEIEDREEAVISALNSAQEGEAVIIYGKGIDNSQRIRGQYIPYKSDASVVEEWMNEK